MAAKKTTTTKAPETKNDDMMTSTPASNEQGAMLQLGGLWVNESKSGVKYMTGYMGNLKLMIFRNNYKKEDNQPDYIMYLAEKPRPENPDENSENKDDIPF